MDSVYYWDIDDKKVIKRRKKELLIGYITTIIVLIFYSFIVFIPFFCDPQKYMMLVLLWIILLPPIVFGLWYTSIKTEKASLTNGIKLTSKELVIYDNKYPLSSVVYSEVVEFMGTQGLSEIFNPNADKWLCILIKDKKGKIKTHLLRYNETTDIQKLSNLIRQLKGLPVQREIKSYGSYKGYYKWKKDVLKMLDGEVGDDTR